MTFLLDYIMRAISHIENNQQENENDNKYKMIEKSRTERMNSIYSKKFKNNHSKSNVKKGRIMVRE